MQFNWIQFTFAAVISHALATPLAFGSRGHSCQDALVSEIKGLNSGEIEKITQELMSLMSQLAQEPKPWTPLITHTLLKVTFLELERKVGTTKAHEIFKEAQTQIFNPRSVAVKDSDQTVDSPNVFHPFNTSAFENTISGHFLPDGQQILLRTLPNLIQIIDLSNHQQKFLSEAHETLIYASSISSDGQYFATGGFDGLGKLWASDTGQELLKFFDLETSTVRSINFSSDGQFIVTASNAVVNLWSARTGELLSTIEPLAGNVLTTSFSHNGQLIGLGTFDKQAQIWNFKQRTQMHKLVGHTSRINSIVFSPDDQYVVTTSADHTAKIWDTETGQLIRTLSDHEQSVNSAVYSHSGKQIITVAGDGFIRFWDSQTGQLLHKQNGIDRSLENISLSPDDQYMIVGAGGDNPKTRIWKTYHSLGSD